MPVPLEELFHYGHLRGVYTREALLLWVWLPFGLVLLVVRLLLFLLLSLLLLVLPAAALPLSPRLVRTGLFLLFGIRIHVRSGAGRLAAAVGEHGGRLVLACNHVTAFDAVPVQALVSTRTLIDAHFFRHVSATFHRLVGAVRVDRTRGRSVVRAAVLDALRAGDDDGRPLLVFPEGWDTSGERAVLRYNKFTLGLGRPVVPVAMRARVPLGVPLRPGCLGVTLATELLWLFFSPGLVWELDILPVLPPVGESGAAAQAARAQEATAAVLGVEASPFTNRDVHRWRRERVPGCAF